MMAVVNGDPVEKASAMADGVELPPASAWHAVHGGSEPVWMIGDVHGCSDELSQLLDAIDSHQPLDFDRNESDPGGRPTICFVGDIVNKGPDSIACIAMARRRNALAVRGNHEHAVLRARAARRADPTAQPRYAWTDNMSAEDEAWLAGLPFTISFPAHNSIVVHAGLVPDIPLAEQAPRNMITMRNLERTADGSFSATEKAPDNSIPWAPEWPVTSPHVIFGHDARRKLQICPNATGIDTGCLYGGELTACRLPGRERIHVPARRPYVDVNKTPQITTVVTRTRAAAARLVAVFWPLAPVAIQHIIARFRGSQL